MDTHHWPQQGIGVTSANKAGMDDHHLQQRKQAASRAPKPPALNCPRCHSSHTKFCYYNNYSLTQPRYFCKTCRRYWTEGGSLRNVPVGGGSRKNKRSSSSSSSNSKNTNTTDHHHHHQTVIPNNNNNFSQNPKFFLHQAIPGQDLNLAFHQPGNYNSALSQFVDLDQHQQNNNPNNSSAAMEMLKFNGLGLTSLMSADSTNIFASSLSFQDFKPTLNFGFDGGYENIGGAGVEENDKSGAGARVFFPYEELKGSTSNSPSDEQFDGGNRAANIGDPANNGYWNAGGGSW
jgi:hypothetical protein